MKKIKIFLISALIISVISYLGFIGLNKILSKKTEPKVFSSETSTAGIVEVEAVPRQLKPGQKMIFTLRLNNHSMSLDYDYTKMAAVVDDEGNIYKPVEWIGGVGGHHVSGDLIFDKLSNRARHVGLNINGIDNKNINFDWEL